MISMTKSQRFLRVLGCVLVLVTVVPAFAQGAPPAQAGGGLVGMLSSKLHVTPAQAQAGAGAIFSYAKQRMSPEQFQKMSSYVPGMDQMLGAAPTPAAGAGAGAAQGQGEAAGAAKTESNNPASALGQITGAGADASKAAGNAAAGAGNAAAGAAGGAAAGAGSGLMSLGSSFQSIGLSPDMAAKFAPVMQQYLSSKGGPGVASSFASAVGLGQ